VRRSTGYSAFELVYGRAYILPVELSAMSWSLVDWDGVKDREDLILARMQQLDEQLWSYRKRLRTYVTHNKTYFDQTHALRPDGDQQLRCGDLVLVHNSAKFKPPRVAKLDDRWLGPYRIREVQRTLHSICWMNWMVRRWLQHFLEIV
jgi:hypothetical protein